MGKSPFHTQNRVKFFWLGHILTNCVMLYAITLKFQIFQPNITGQMNVLVKIGVFDLHGKYLI